MDGIARAPSARVHHPNVMDCRRALTLVLLALLAAGCAGRLGLPEPRVASADVAGVEVVATAGAWRGWPADLRQVVTPVKVTIANRGRTPIRVDATTFSLALAEGGRLAAALPTDVRGVVTEPAPAASPSAGLGLGPTRERSGPGWAINDPRLDPRGDPAVEPDRAWELPSADMLDLALPEGVLAAGQTVSGFVYFERPPRGVSAVTLTWPVVDTAGERLGTVAIPLTLR